MPRSQAPRSRMGEVTAALGGRLAFGGDYNPEQWPEDVWARDAELMQQAGVNLVSVGIFSWALLEPAEGVHEFGWLDRVLDLLHGAGIGVDLATATASPPPWFFQAHPEALLTDETGGVRSFGSRQVYCPSSVAYRRAAVALCSAMAARYADHPAVVMWHVNNEYGCHNWHCFCDQSATAYRSWLQGRYGDLDSLNEAWGTAFWSQRYSDWQQVQPPRAVSYNSFANPGQQLDWWRFSSSALLGCYRAEAAALREVVSQPVTTNFMGFFKPVDYREWALEQDLVSNDHYLLAEDSRRAQHLAMTSDLMRTLAGGQPWLVMEHSTSAVNWQPRNIAKLPGEMRRNTMQHVARGADGALFFQWRASRAGAEKFHSAMVPHAGTQSRLWRDVVALGRDLALIAEVGGSTVEQAKVALLFDWPSWWAAELDSHPSQDVHPLQTARRWHDLCWSSGVGVDVVGPLDDLGPYRLVVVPVQYLVDDALVRALEQHVSAGGTVVVTYFSGIVDQDDHVRLGGYPGALRDLVGVSVEEFHPLGRGESVRLTAFDGGTVWSELGRTTGAEVLASYAEGPCTGSPAVTRHSYGAGSTWYVGTELSDDGLAELGARVLAAAEVSPVVTGAPVGVEVLRRRRGTLTWVFVVNHTDDDVELPLGGTDLLTGVSGSTTRVPAGGVAVVREG